MGIMSDCRCETVEGEAGLRGFEIVPDYVLGDHVPGIDGLVDVSGDLADVNVAQQHSLYGVPAVSVDSVDGLCLLAVCVYEADVAYPGDGGLEGRNDFPPLVEDVCVDLEDVLDALAMTFSIVMSSMKPPRRWLVLR